MLTLVLLAVTFLIATPSLILLFKLPKKQARLIHILSVILFLVYLVRLFSYDTINQTFNLFLVYIETRVNASDTWLFSPFLTFAIIVLRWFSVIMVAWIFVAVLYPLKHLKLLIGWVGIITSVLNIILFSSHAIALQNSTELTLRSGQFILEIALVFGISLLYLISNWSLVKELKQPKTWGAIGLILLGSLVALMPQTLFINLFGNYGAIPKKFNVEHLMLILLPVGLSVVIYFIAKNKTQEQREAVILFMAVAMVFQYFYMRRPGLAALPLHLCNTAVILIFLAVTFKIKSFFYFAYFANVIGAIGGIVLPNYEADLYTLTVIHFVYNHTNALIIPILAVSLGVFEKPKLKSMYQAILVFIAYFIAMVFLNAWFNNYTETDYFFAYSNFLPKMLGITKVRSAYIYNYLYKDMTFTFYWLFQLIYFLTFIFLMFVSWYVYDASYQAIYQRRALKGRQHQMKMDKKMLMFALSGRTLKDRMNEEYKHMIQIKNFSKRYGKSKNYAVKDFSLEVGPGEIFGFLGPNGAGKSTTIKSMVGIQSITEGEIYLDGYSIKSQPIEAKLQMGYVSDNHAVYEKLTGREYIHYVADLYQVDKDLRDERLESLLVKLNLKHAIDNEVKSYSHGMKQKLVVIASLIHEPSIWILDEPLTGLDPTSAYQIKESMREHAEKGNIVFFSSHVIEVVEKICTKIAVINQGELIGVYEVAKLKEEGVSLETLYFQG